MAQPCVFGPMLAVTDRKTHTVTIMAGTQILKTELLNNVAAFYICQDPASILFVQPTQGAAEVFSKERFAPTIEVTPQLRALVDPPKSRDSGNTITHKDYAGGSLDFVGANSPTDLASRPKRIILADEIDKYPISAGSEGDPLKLAEERASTYKALGRAKFVRTCSPTVEGLSRIGREYAASDQRRLFVACRHHHRIGGPDPCCL
jgi:phage terminase large subunit GpA-like protein